VKKSISGKCVGSQGTPPSPQGSWAATLRRRKPFLYLPPTHLSCLPHGLHSLSHTFSRAWSSAMNSTTCSPANTISPLSCSDCRASGAQHSPWPAPHCKRSNTDSHLKCCVVRLVDHSVARPFNLPTVCCPIQRQEL